MIVSWIGRHTPGTEALILGKAVAEKDVSRAARLTGAVVGRGELAELVNDSFDPPVDLVLQLAQRRARVAEQAFRIAETLPAPLSDELTTALCVAARRGSISDTAAVRALRKARPTAEVREALAAALESSDADVRGLALDSLGELFGVGARPYWQAWLASSSAPQRMAAEDVIGAYGDADDVPLAAEHLGKIIRRKSSISWQPPRGNEIITLLVRHRDLPEAQAALADLTKRWPKLPEELQALVDANTIPTSSRRRQLHSSSRANPTTKSTPSRRSPGRSPRSSATARSSTSASGTPTCSISGIGSRTCSRRIRP